MRRELEYSLELEIDGVTFLDPRKGRRFSGPDPELPVNLGVIVLVHSS